MSESTIAIVGSGPAGAAVAHALVARGHDVVVFEKGPDYAYPHEPQFEEQVTYLHVNPAYELPRDLRRVQQSGTYHYDLNDDLYQVVGGAGTVWAGLALRVLPSDFRTKSLYGYGADWPISYDDLEPWLCAAEAHMGVAGTDDDNPFAPPRSKPYPMPPFELSSDDVRFAAMLREKGIVLHTTAQTRNRVDYGDRAGCVNYGTCWVCPIGARYSPNYHLQLAASTGRCRVISNATVRRVAPGPGGRARAIVYRLNHESADREHAAKAIVLAGGALETSRLLLLSRDAQHPEGLGNASGQVGQNFLLHHGWGGKLHYREALAPARFGGWTGQSFQFIDGPDRKRRGGIKVEFPFGGEPPDLFKAPSDTWRDGADVVRDLQARRHWHAVRMHSEPTPGPEKNLTLSAERDRFGDPIAHIHYDVNDRDRETHRFAGELLKRFADATGADDLQFADVHGYHSSVHHMGGCRWGLDPATSVTDAFGRVHGIAGLWVAGAATFPTTGSVNPTLTLVAQALRVADHVASQGL